MKKYSIGGVFVKRTLVGVVRYCWELIAELDNAVEGHDIQLELVVPKGVKVPYKYKNIKVVHYGKDIKFFWYNVILPWYLKRNHSVGIHLAVNVPWIKPDIVCIHDINSTVNPQLFSRYHVFKTTLEKKMAVKRAKKLLAVSHFSASEIARYFKYPESKITVVPNAWQHMERLETKGDSESLYGVKKGTYYFSMSSIAPTKNFKWIMEAAKQNPDDMFLIAGGIDPKTFGVSSLEGKVQNVKYVGRVSDEEAKILMRDCKAFLFPSFYEGFGIPPLEALACGAPRIVVSDIPVMREVYGDTANYIDPSDYDNIDLKKTMSVPVAPPEKVLEKYSWRKSADILVDVLDKL